MQFLPGVLQVYVLKWFGLKRVW